MLARFTRFIVLLLLPSSLLAAQTSVPSSGDVTVRLIQPLDSANARPNQVAPGTVQRSTNPAIPNGTTAAVALTAEPAGGFSVHLVRLGINGHLMRTASGNGVLAGVSKLGGFLHDQNTPKTAASGPHVYLPASTDIRFTLSDAPPQAPAPPPGRVARRAPEPPQHPANTVVDLPPAAAGYPPIHASYPAQENCWWIPFLSEKYGFEAAVQTCTTKQLTSNVLESEHGLALQYLGNTPLSPPQEFVTVLSKPADQSIQDAIKQQFLSKLKVAAARQSCKVFNGMNGGVDPNTKKSVTEADTGIYSIGAIGPYSKLKKFQGEEAEYPCPDLQSNDAIEMYFQYNPAESKTKFLFYQVDDNGIVFDGGSIHFKPQ